MVSSPERLRDGSFVSDRYKVIRQIGQGGFGRTYLAVDTSRYDERCVLKEFVPAVSNDRDLQKAEELFEREAGILYQLEHDQIPEFKALLRTRVNRKKCLFLVQQYIEGETYQERLKDRGRFNESEISELLLEVLPVLEHIHGQNLIHRDISPDNLIYRYSDKKPVLIDFGCVKVAANAVSRSQGHTRTLIGKKGFAPEEQMRHGQAFPCSDFYSLAATAIVLLTAQSPEQLYDPHSGHWQWEQEVKVNSRFAKVLNKMLAYRPSDRYQTATEVISALKSQRSNLAINGWISRLQTIIIAPKNKVANSTEVEPSTPATQITQPYQKPRSSPAPRRISHLKTQVVSNSQNVSRLVSSQVEKVPYVRDFGPWQWGAVFTAALIIPGVISFAVVQNNLLGGFSGFKLPKIENPFHKSQLPTQETQLQKDLYQRIKALKLNESAFFGKVDREFHRQYPQLKGITLSDRSEHIQYRRSWYQIADRLLRQQGG